MSGSPWIVRASDESTRLVALDDALIETQEEGSVLIAEFGSSLGAMASGSERADVDG